ncbi:helix-turn-helix transcriptional regulator [Streptomyces sp. NPDC002853]
MVSEAGEWTFLTNHARVLLAIARGPAVPLRQVAAVCRISERTAQAVVADLEQAGYLHRRRVGRCNQYSLRLDQMFRHPAEAGISVRALVELFDDRKAGTAPPAG